MAARAGAEGEIVFAFEFDHVGKRIVFAVVEDFVNIRDFHFRQVAVFTCRERSDCQHTAAEQC